MKLDTPEGEMLTTENSLPMTNRAMDLAIAEAQGFHVSKKTHTPEQGTSLYAMRNAQGKRVTPYMHGVPELRDFYWAIPEYTTDLYHIMPLIGKLSNIEEFVDHLVKPHGLSFKNISIDKLMKIQHTATARENAEAYLATLCSGNKEVTTIAKNAAQREGVAEPKEGTTIAPEEHPVEYVRGKAVRVYNLTEPTKEKEQEDTLEPCPFCERKDLSTGNYWGTKGGYVSCVCGVLLQKVGGTIKDAKAAWNLRPRKK